MAPALVQWDRRRVSQFGRDFPACEGRAVGGPSRTGRRCVTDEVADSFLGPTMPCAVEL